MELFIWLLIALAPLALLAMIPARIAEKKGRSYANWYVYGFFFWIVAVIHASLAYDLTPQPLPESQENRPQPVTTDNEDDGSVKTTPRAPAPLRLK